LNVISEITFEAMSGLELPKQPAWDWQSFAQEKTNRLCDKEIGKDIMMIIKDTTMIISIAKMIVNAIKRSSKA
jgi:hypothetical protein